MLAMKRISHTHENTLSDFLSSKGWFEKKCISCGNRLFTKKRLGQSQENCERSKCSNNGNTFLKLSRRSRMLTIPMINDQIESFFKKNHFSRKDPMPMVNPNSKTDVIMAGVQILDGVIHGNDDVDNGRIFISQPSMRMQYQSLVKEFEGTSTSFVNICTEHMDATIENHLAYIDLWLTALSLLGLHMNDFKLVMRMSNKDWGTGAISSLELFFVYCDIELGDAAFAFIPHRDNKNLVISDIGFGLERIAWAVNKTPSYFDQIRPLSQTLPREYLDTCRSLSLLALTGIQAKNKGPGFQFRRFAKVLAIKYPSSCHAGVLEYYFSYWSQFIEPLVSLPAAMFAVNSEIGRLRNSRLADSFKESALENESTEDYLLRLFLARNATIDEIEVALKHERANT